MGWITAQRDLDLTETRAFGLNTVWERLPEEGTSNGYVYN